MRPPVAGILYRLFRSDSRIAGPEDPAAALGIDRATAYRWTNGETDPGTVALVRILDAYQEAREPVFDVLFGKYGQQMVPESADVEDQVIRAIRELEGWQRKLARKRAEASRVESEAELPLEGEAK